MSVSPHRKTIGPRDLTTLQSMYRLRSQYERAHAGCVDLHVEMGKNPKLCVLVWVRVLSKAGSVRVWVLCLPSKFGLGSVRVLRDYGFSSGSSS
jgi:hypothetical protein